MISRILIQIIYFYRWFISPFLKPACRFEPSCSRYAIHALELHGIFKGSWLIIKRLMRCHPYESLSSRIGRTFGYDPVPHPFKKIANQDHATSYVPSPSKPKTPDNKEL